MHTFFSSLFYFYVCFFVFFCFFFVFFCRAERHILYAKQLISSIARSKNVSLLHYGRLLPEVMKIANNSREILPGVKPIDVNKDNAVAIEGQINGNNFYPIIASEAINRDNPVNNHLYKYHIGDRVARKNIRKDAPVSGSALTPFGYKISVVGYNRREDTRVQGLTIKARIIKPATSSRSQRTLKPFYQMKEQPYTNQNYWIEEKQLALLRCPHNDNQQILAPSQQSSEASPVIPSSPVSVVPTTSSPSSPLIAARKAKKRVLDFLQPPTGGKTASIPPPPAPLSPVGRSQSQNTPLRPVRQAKSLALMFASKKKK